LNASHKRGIVRFVVLGLLSLGILMLHPWTWGVFLATVIVAAVLSMQRRAELRDAIRLALSAVWLAVPIGVGAFVFLPGIQAGITNAFSLYSYSLFRPKLILGFIGAWYEMFRQWSSFLSPALIVIALIGAFGLIGQDRSVKRYMLAWLVVWCVGSFLVAPIGYNPAKPTTSENQLWRMLYVSPLPVLLAIGLKKCLDTSRRLESQLSTGIAWIQPAALSVVIGISSLPIFISTLPVISLVFLLAGILTVFLMASRLGIPSSARVLIGIVLVLIVVNAAFRSLFPLLFDPHNVYPSSSI
jgi:hypothetical protein